MDELPSPIEEPLVSVVIPSKEASATMAECLGSVSRQSYRNVEFIVIDDSTDGTDRIAIAYGAKLIRLGGGPSTKRNYGVEVARGKYVIFVDQDQVLSPRVVEECVRVAEQSSGRVGMIKIPEIFTGKTTVGTCAALWKMSGSSHVTEVPRFYLRSAVISAGLFDESTEPSEDVDLHMRAVERGVGEARCMSPICHIEPTSFRRLILKNVLLGVKRGRSRPLRLMIRQTRALSQLRSFVKNLLSELVTMRSRACCCPLVFLVQAEARLVGHGIALKESITSSLRRKD